MCMHTALSYRCIFLGNALVFSLVVTDNCENYRSLSDRADELLDIFFSLFQGTFWPIIITQYKDNPPYNNNYTFHFILSNNLNKATYMYQFDLDDIMKNNSKTDYKLILLPRYCHFDRCRIFFNMIILFLCWLFAYVNYF